MSHTTRSQKVGHYDVFSSRSISLTLKNAQPKWQPIKLYASFYLILLTSLTGQCVSSNQNADWPKICLPQSRALTLCADTAVPHLARVKSECAGSIASYRACLDRNASRSDAEVESACSGFMKGVWECSERVMRDVKA